MVRRVAATAAGFGAHSVSAESAGEPAYLLSALFNSSILGVAICDRQLRFCAIDDALASMNGIPAADHLGKTIHGVLGEAAAKIQPAFEHVFATGQLLSNVEVIAELPSRRAVGHWNATYFPIKDDTGQVNRGGALVLELTKRSEIETALLRLTNNLTTITSMSRRDLSALEPSGSEQVCANPSGTFSRSVGLLESCLLETRVISQMLQDAPPLVTVPPLQVVGLRQPKSTNGINFAVAHPIEDELEYSALLSSREREVVALLATGKFNKEIAKSLIISTRTVESHRAKIMLKLDMHSFSELVRYAVRTHLIQP
jgi:DNA-binding CsgD family transcriptional regulator